MKAHRGSGRNLELTCTVLDPATRNALYRDLLKFADFVANRRACGDVSPLRVTVKKTVYLDGGIDAADESTPEDKAGLGLCATDDIQQGETVVWYGGPFVSILDDKRDALVNYM